MVVSLPTRLLSYLSLKGHLLQLENNLLDALILCVLLVPLCLVEDMSSLSKLSRLGLIIILILTILVIAGYGISGYDDLRRKSGEFNPFHFLPCDGITGVSQRFGCVVFGFGIVPLTFNFRESMAQPECLLKTSMVSMLLVAVAYIVTGVVLLYLYPDIHDDILSDLPGGWLATLARLAMIVVVMATARREFVRNLLHIRVRGCFL